jgi:hypothetical protein
MPVTREIPVQQLLLDVENPRLDDVQSSQTQTLHRMLTSPKEHLLPLVKSVAERGLSPMYRFFVMPEASAPGRYVVLEGNRRIAAVKLLDHPELAAPVLTAAQLRWLREQQRVHRARGGITSISAQVFGSREEADPWLLLHHGGEQQGAGLVRWGSTEKARFAQRRLGRKDPTLQVIEFVERSGALDDATLARLRRVPRTNIERLIDDRAVRTYLGLERHHGVIYTTHDGAETVKLLAKLVTEAAHGRLKVTDIEKTPDRLKYIKKLGPTPSPSKRLPAPEPLDLAIGATVTPPGRRSASKSSVSTASTARKTLIPRSASCEVSDPRIADLARELRGLDLERFSNAAGVAFRVLLELSVDHYLVGRGLRTEEQLRAGLEQKTQIVVDDLKTKAIMTYAQLKGARTLTSSHGPFGVDTFHAYVHNQYFSPAPIDLKKNWDNLALFFDRIWRPKDWRPSESE